MNNNNSSRWYAVYTRPRAEKKVYAQLVQKGIEAYLPLTKVRRQWSDRMKTVEEPFLPGYVFVKVTFIQYYNVLVIPGALHYVCFEGKPAAIPDWQIEDLKIFMACEESAIEVTSERIRKDDLIKVISGPLCNVRGEVVEIRGRKRILLRFDSLGYCILAEMGVNKVELLEKDKSLCFPVHN